MTLLRFGILGCADFALRRMLPAIASAPGCAVAAIASRRVDRAREVAQAYGCRAVEGYERLLEDDEIDAVYLPLPPALHAPWAEAALQAGKHVLVEKPLSLDAASTARLVAIAERQGLALAENILFVHHGQHTAVRELIAAGAIGELRAFHASFTIPRRAPGDIRLQAGLGGGALWDTGVYPLRAASYFLGPGLTVEGATSIADQHAGVDIAGSILLRRADGVGATATFGIDHVYSSSYSVCGSLGRIVVSRAFTPTAGQEPDVVIERGAETEPVALAAQDQTVAAVAAFAAAVRLRQPPDPGEVCEQARLRDAARVAGQRHITI